MKAKERFREIRINGWNIADDTSKTSGVLYCSGTGGGIGWHIYAVRVTRDEDGCQVPVDDPEGRLEDFYRVDPTDGGFDTVEIVGYDYVVCALPWGV